MAEYIDREALMEYLAALECIGGGGREANIGEWLLHEFLPSGIAKIPAADVVEVRHAHWIEDDREATCSGCKSRTFNWAAWSFDYCPFCGSKMDGKGEESV